MVPFPLESGMMVVLATTLSDGGGKSWRPGRKLGGEVSKIMCGHLKMREGKVLEVNSFKFW